VNFLQLWHRLAKRLVIPDLSSHLLTPVTHITEFLTVTYKQYKFSFRQKKYCVYNPPKGIWQSCANPGGCTPEKQSGWQNQGCQEQNLVGYQGLGREWLLLTLIKARVASSIIKHNNYAITLSSIQPRLHHSTCSGSRLKGADTILPSVPPPSSLYMCIELVILYMYNISKHKIY
jgi:hypothetical protein